MYKMVLSHHLLNAEEYLNYYRVNIITDIFIIEDPYKISTKYFILPKYFIIVTNIIRAVASI